MTLLVVQRGHVPRTSGATGAPGEQAFAIETAERVAARVGALGHDVRIIDADVPVSSYRGDLFVALHYDSSTSPAARGASVGYRTPEGQEFAHAWKRHYENNGWTGGFRADNYTAALGGYYGVKRAVEQGNRRAFIAEAGFHSNADDAALLASPAGPDRVAIAIAAAVLDLVGGSCPPPPPPPPIPGGFVMVALPLLRSGSRGGAVRSLQGLLNVKAGQGLTVDGIFGRNTARAVDNVQAFFGLDRDGIVGQHTWGVLFL